jgi:hypothetical protein
MNPHVRTSSGLWQIADMVLSPFRGAETRLHACTSLLFTLFFLYCRILSSSQMATSLIDDMTPGSPIRSPLPLSIMPATPRKPKPGPRVDRNVVPFPSLLPMTPCKTQRRYPFHSVFHFYDRNHIRRSTFLYAAQDEVRYLEVITRGERHPRLLEDFLTKLPQEESAFCEYAWPIQNGLFPTDITNTIHVYLS